MNRILETRIGKITTLGATEITPTIGGTEMTKVHLGINHIQTGGVATDQGHITGQIVGEIDGTFQLLRKLLKGCLL